MEDWKRKKEEKPKREKEKERERKFFLIEEVREIQ